MGHPERVIDPADGPLAAFAVDLVELRKTTVGGLTLRQLEARSGYSKAALSQACSGRALPTLELTLAYVGACGADMGAWETRWRALATQLQAAEPGRAPVDPAGAGSPVPVSAVGEARVHGLSLHEAVARHGPLPESCVRNLAARLAEILGDRHRAGIAHHDLNPDSVLLDEDAPRLVGLGTASGAVPAQRGAGNPQGPADDVFALGALLVFAATGASPSAEGPRGLFTRVVHRGTDLHNLGRLSPELRELIRACLNKDPAARPGTDRIISVCAAGEQPGPWSLPPGLSALAVPRSGAAATAPTAVPAAPDRAAAPSSRGRRIRRRWQAVPILAAVVLAALLFAHLTGGQPQAPRHGALPGPTTGVPRDTRTPGASTSGSPARTEQPGGGATPTLAAGSTPPGTSPSSDTANGPALPAPSGAARQRTLVPLYAPPDSSSWSSLESAAPTARAAVVDICAPDNTGSGCNGQPADAANPAWPATINTLRSAGVLPLYFISTNYAATALSTVESEVSNAITWYNTPNIFFDQVPVSCADVSYYQSLYSYVHSLGGIVALDPGAVNSTSSCYMPDADILEIFVGSQSQFQSETFPSWLTGYPSSRFAAVISAGTASGVGTDVADAAGAGIGNVYIDDETQPPTYDTLPAFWSTELTDISARQ